MSVAGTPAGWRVGAAAIVCLLAAAVVDVSAAGPAAGTPPAGRPAVATLEQARRSLADATRQHAEGATLEHERALALAYVAADVPDQALDHFSAALLLDPHDVVSLEGTARIWRDWGYLDVALPFAYRAAFWGADSASIQNTLGTVLLKAGQFEAAASRFVRARELEPDSAFPINNLCYLELQRSRPDAAAPLCRMAVARDPLSQILRNNLVMALAQGGAYAEARLVTGEGQQQAVAAYNEGIIWLAERQPKQALEAFGRAREADPSYRPALRTLRQLTAPGKDARR